MFSPSWLLAVRCLRGILPKKLEASHPTTPQLVRDLAMDSAHPSTFQPDGFFGMFWVIDLLTESKYGSAHNFFLRLLHISVKHSLKRWIFLMVSRSGPAAAKAKVKYPSTCWEMLWYAYVFLFSFLGENKCRGTSCISHQIMLKVFS